MLVLTRKTQEQIQIGNNITITILRVKGQSVQVGIEAPRDIRVLRGELRSDLVEQAHLLEPANQAENAEDAQQHVEHQPTRAGMMRNPPAFERREAFGPRTSPVRTGKPAVQSSKPALSSYLSRRRSPAIDCVSA